jgi:DNA modification methylase
MITAFKTPGPDRYLSFDNPLGRLRHNFKTHASVNMRLRPLYLTSVGPVLRESFRVIKPGAYVVAWAFARTQHWLAIALEDAGFGIIDTITRNTGRRRPKTSLGKDGCSPGLVQETEFWVLARKPGEPTATETRRRWGTGFLNVVESGHRLTNYFAGFTDKKKFTSHPNEKSLQWMRQLVRVVCPPDGCVLDPWAGSGTTGVACVNEDRRFLGVEVDAKWAALASSRIDAAMEL